MGCNIIHPPTLDLKTQEGEKTVAIKIPDIATGKTHYVLVRKKGRKIRYERRGPYLGDFFTQAEVYVSFQRGGASKWSTDRAGKIYLPEEIFPLCLCQAVKRIAQIVFEMYPDRETVRVLVDAVRLDEHPPN